jgi:DNA anti-recombination protein RmuC
MVISYRIGAMTVVPFLLQIYFAFIVGQSRLVCRRAMMTTDLRAKLKDLRIAERDFVKAAKQANAKLSRDLDRINAKLKQANARVKRAQEQLKIEAKQLATTSKSTAARTRIEFQSQVAKLKATISKAKDEARKTRSELVLVWKELAEARQHLSHALHIDKAIVRVEDAIAERRTARKKAA